MARLGGQCTASLLGALLLAATGCDGQRFESMRADAAVAPEPSSSETASNGVDAASTDAGSMPRLDAASPTSTDGTGVDTTEPDSSSEQDTTSDEGVATSDPSSEPTTDPDSDPTLDEAGAISDDAQATDTQPDWDASDRPTDASTLAPDGSVFAPLDGGTSTDALDASVPGLVPTDASPCDADASCLDSGDATARDAATDAADAAQDAGPVVDPSDECPDHPEQTLRGSCGCGFQPDEVCTLLEDGLTHRYRFDGEGQTAFDSVGNADAEIIGAELDDSGSLELDGIDDYVSLPANIPFESTDVTFEAWLTWHGGDDWQRIFDFGNLASNGAELQPKTYIYLSPRGGQASGKQALLFAHSTNGSGNTAHVHGDGALPVGQLSHVAVVLNTTARRVAIYADGARLDSDDFDHDLNDFNDSINSIGRSLFDEDPYLAATLHEFRIYGRSLSESQVQKSYDLGPDTTYSQAE